MKYRYKVRAATLEAARRLRRQLADVVSASRPHTTWREPPPPPPPQRPAAPGLLVKAPPVLQLLTFQLDGVTIIKGTEDAGINIQQDGVNVVTGGDGSITVQQDGVEV